MFANFDFDVIWRSLPYLFYQGMTFTLLLTALATIGGNGRAGVIGLHQACERRGANALCPRLLGKLPLPGLKTAGPAAALRGLRWRGETRERCHHDQARESNPRKLPAADHCNTPFAA